MSVKSHVYALFAQGGLSHQAIADSVREAFPNAQTTARSVASMKVDYRRAGGEASSSEPRGQVKELVYALFAQGGLTHKQVAAKVRETIPTAQTTDKSVASMMVDYKRSRPVVEEDVYAWR